MVAISTFVRPMRSARCRKRFRPPTRSTTSGHQQPRRIKSKAELRLEGRHGHQVDHEIEGIERPSGLAASSVFHWAAVIERYQGSVIVSAVRRWVRGHPPYGRIRRRRAFRSPARRRLGQ